jgi:predicted transglutaminase-like cysteine proteinase
MKMRLALAFGAVLFGITTSAMALETASGSPSKDMFSVKEYGKALPPVGYVKFCASGQEECKTKGGKVERVLMTAERWVQLTQINNYVNGKIAPVSDQELYGETERWAYPVNAGDCEDYVLLKKRYLEGIGFNADELLITVLLDEKGEGHAVLMVTTNGGDFILDNRRNEILRWDQTNYKFLKRQSQLDPKLWVRLQKTSTQVLVGSQGK